MEKQGLLKPGELIKDKYHIDKVIGQGGMGKTFLANEIGSGNQVVLKVLIQSQMESWKVLELFEREAKILKNMNHPNIPKYIDEFHIETETEMYYVLVMEYIEGKNLYNLIADGKRFTELEVIEILKSMLQTLDYIHSLNPCIIHRDIQPKNIIYHPSGKIYLTDFGGVGQLMKEAIHGGNTMIGTFGYFPQEQLYGKSYPASDLYSLGITTIFTLTGKDPSEFELKNGKIYYASQVNISNNLINILDKMIEPFVENRIADAQSVLRLINEAYSKPILKTEPIIKEEDKPKPVVTEEQSVKTETVSKVLPRFVENIKVEPEVAEKKVVQEVQTEPVVIAETDINRPLSEQEINEFQNLKPQAKFKKLNKTMSLHYFVVILFGILFLTSIFSPVIGTFEIISTFLIIILSIWSLFGRLRNLIVDFDSISTNQYYGKKAKFFTILSLNEVQKIQLISTIENSKKPKETYSIKLMTDNNRQTVDVNSFILNNEKAQKIYNRLAEYFIASRSRLSTIFQMTHQVDSVSKRDVLIGFKDTNDILSEDQINHMRQLAPKNTIEFDNDNSIQFTFRNMVGLSTLMTFVISFSIGLTLFTSTIIFFILVIVGFFAMTASSNDKIIELTYESISLAKVSNEIQKNIHSQLLEDIQELQIKKRFLSHYYLNIKNLKGKDWKIGGSLCLDYNDVQQLKNIIETYILANRLGLKTT